jgi:hypothetical protein
MHPLINPRKTLLLVFHTIAAAESSRVEETKKEAH